MNVKFTQIPSAGIPVGILRDRQLSETIVPQYAICSDAATNTWAVLVLMPAEDGAGIELKEISGQVETWLEFADRNAVKIVGGLVALGSLFAGGLAMGAISLPSLTADSDEDEPLA